MSEDFYRQRAETAEAQLATLKYAQAAAIDRVRQFKANFGIRERSNGDLVIDYQKFVKALGLEAALELRKEIDLAYRITGEAGEKPRVRASAQGELQV